MAKEEGGIINEHQKLKGCYPDTMRGLHHQNLGYKLALIARSINPKIVVMDGIYGLNGHGPTYGEPVKMNLIITSDNPVVADTLGASIIVFSPNKIGHIKLAEKEGLGTTNLEDVRINKGWMQYKRELNIKKKFVDRLSSLPFHSGAVAKLIMDSKLTPAIYKVVGLLKSSEAKEVTRQMRQQETVGSYKKIKYSDEKKG